MDSILFADSHVVAPLPGATSPVHHHQLPCTLSYHSRLPQRPSFLPTCSISRRRLQYSDRVVEHRLPASLTAAGTTNSMPPRDGTYRVGDFMTKKEDLHVVKTTTTVDEALETLVEKRITGFPVIDDDWKLVGIVSDYDLLALDSISGGGHADTNLFPDVDSSWKTFNEIQKLLGKTNGKVVGDLMTPAPLVVLETTNREDAVRLLLETKYHRLPVVDGDGKLVGILTRGNVVRAALKIKHASEKMP
uniref:CBS domain-containing protein n=1 Tax=Davidia involucrata TaxID=16924 RepID=A0A5B7A5V5_DAVIN